RSCGGSLALPAHLAQFRGTPLEAAHAVDLFLPSSGEAGVILRPEDAVLVQPEAEADRAIAQRDVMGLRPGEVLERRAAAFGWDQSKIGLKSAPDENARFRFTAPEDAL